MFFAEAAGVTLPEPSHGVAKPNGGTGGLLPIIDVAVTGIGRAVQILAGSLLRSTGCPGCWARSCW